MTLQLYNTLSGKKEPFIPLHKGKIGLYVCGMTVYDFCHVGHARVLVAFDMIVRYLRARGFDVHYVRNITDIDDKILQRAADNNEPYTVLTQRFIDAMHVDEQCLGVQSPDHEPRATDHIDAMLRMIGTLLDKGFAYQADNGDIYYAVARFSRYGRLAKKKPADLLAGARVAINEAKRDPRDFVLWKAAAADEVCWDSPWGKGRPGWHIECSAMSVEHVGSTLDIHGGGPDLCFPHHENEIAQSEAVTGQPFARYWMHVGAVRIEGEKMSKSLGNFFTLREVFEQYHPEVLRYLLLSSHYRSAIHYSAASLQRAQQSLLSLYAVLDQANTDASLPTLDALRASDQTVAAFVMAFRAAMDDDFNTPAAIAVLFDLLKTWRAAEKKSDTADTADTAEAIALATALKSLAHLLGLGAHSAQTIARAHVTTSLGEEAINAKIAARATAKADKNYTLADRIRAELAEQGVVLEDSQQGTTWRWQ